MEAAFTVGVGQFDDPGVLPGLAHLTEHLVLSSPGPPAPVGQPASASLGDWLDELDGDANGFTGFDSASFFVSVPAELWNRTLQRFGYALTRGGDPATRFGAEAVKREVGRVDEELLGESIPVSLRDLQLLRYRTAPDHPLRRFGPGCARTLLPAGSGDRAVAELGAASRQLYESAFAAEAATLALVAPFPLDALEAAAAMAFGALPKRTPTTRRDDAARRLAALADPFPALPGGALPSILFVGASQPSVSLTWSVPLANAGTYAGAGVMDAAAFRATKPLVVLSHLLAHQGPGSLSAWLRAQQWLAESPGPKVSARVPFATEQGFALFEVRVELSTLGIANWRLVVGAVFGALAALSRSRKARPGGKGGEVLEEAAREVSALADIAWCYPDRPPSALELANDMRTAPASSYAVAAPRRFYEPDVERLFEDSRQNAVRTSDRACSAAVESAARLLDVITLERARVLAAGAPEEAGAAIQQDPFLSVKFGEVPVDAKTRDQWRAAATTVPSWWSPPPRNIYVPRIDPVEAPAAVEAAGGLRFRPPQCLPQADVDAEGMPPAVLWTVPDCLYVSGQFMEALEPLGNEPLATVTLWLPAQRIREGDFAARAAGRVWLIALQRALESPLYGAALAGCRWEAAFFNLPTGDVDGETAAGLRLSFQAYSDVLPRFAVDVADFIGRYAGPDEVEFKLARDVALRELRRGPSVDGTWGNGAMLQAMEKLQAGDVGLEIGALWKSIEASLTLGSQALVAGRVGGRKAARALASSIVRSLPIKARPPSKGDPVSDAKPASVLASPPAVLIRRPTWQGPVAQSLCLASGLPALLDVCGRPWNR